MDDHLVHVGHVYFVKKPDITLVFASEQNG